jgi:hypothetical protein
LRRLSPVRIRWAAAVGALLLGVGEEAAAQSAQLDSGRVVVAVSDSRSPLADALVRSDGATLTLGPAHTPALVIDQAALRRARLACERNGGNASREPMPDPRAFTKAAA